MKITYTGYKCKYAKGEQLYFFPHNFFEMYSACMYVCALCVYLMPEEVRRGYWLSWNWVYR